MCAGPIAFGSVGNFATGMKQPTNLAIQGSPWKWQWQWRIIERPSLLLPPLLGWPFNSVSKLRHFGNGVLKIIFHWSTLAVLGRVRYIHSILINTFTHSNNFSGLPPLSFSPSSLPFPPCGSSLALKHSPGSLSRECSTFLILGAPAHTEWPCPGRLHTWWVKAEPWQLQIQAILPQLLRCQKMYLWLLCSTQCGRPRVTVFYYIAKHLAKVLTKLPTHSRCVINILHIDITTRLIYSVES